MRWNARAARLRLESWRPEPGYLFFPLIVDQATAYATKLAPSRSPALAEPRRIESLVARWDGWIAG